jgi:hypothetical protein
MRVMCFLFSLFPTSGSMLDRFGVNSFTSSYYTWWVGTRDWLVNRHLLSIGWHQERLLELNAIVKVSKSSFIKIC